RWVGSLVGWTVGAPTKWCAHTSTGLVLGAVLIHAVGKATRPSVAVTCGYAPADGWTAGTCDRVDPRPRRRRRVGRAVRVPAQGPDPVAATGVRAAVARVSARHLDRRHGACQEPVAFLD